MGSGTNWKSKSFSSSETTLALASLVASASAAITRCISFAKHTSLISTLVCKRGRKFIFWLEIQLKCKNIYLISLWEVYPFVITMNKDSPEDMYSPLVRCPLKVRRQLLCNFLPRKIRYEKLCMKHHVWILKSLKVKRGAMWHRSGDRTTDIYNLPLREHFGEAVCSQDIPKWWQIKSTKFSQKNLSKISDG